MPRAIERISEDIQQQPATPSSTVRHMLIQRPARVSQGVGSGSVGRRPGRHRTESLFRLCLLPHLAAAPDPNFGPECRRQVCTLRDWEFIGLGSKRVMVQTQGSSLPAAKNSRVVSMAFLSGPFCNPLFETTPTLVDAGTSDHRDPTPWLLPPSFPITSSCTSYIADLRTLQ